MAHTILIIDDEEEIRVVLQYLLESRDYRILQAADGLGGLEVARRERPDLVILDIEMPVMNGHETWRRFKASKDLKHIPILILTCERQSEDRYWGASIRKEDFITKPYEEDYLIRRIDEMIKEGRRD